MNFQNNGASMLESGTLSLVISSPPSQKTTRMKFEGFIIKTRIEFSIDYYLSWRLLRTIADWDSNSIGCFQGREAASLKLHLFLQNGRSTGVKRTE